MLLSLLDDRRQVSASTILHQNVQCTGVAVNIAVIIFHDMGVVEILQDVASGASGQTSSVYFTNDADEHLGNNLLAIAFIHTFKINLFAS